MKFYKVIVRIIDKDYLCLKGIMDPEETKYIVAKNINEVISSFNQEFYRIIEIKEMYNSITIIGK